MIPSIEHNFNRPAVSFRSAAEFGSAPVTNSNDNYRDSYKNTLKGLDAVVQNNNQKIAGMGENMQFEGKGKIDYHA